MISFSGVWVVLSETSPSSSAFYRVFFGALFLFLTAALAKEKPAGLRSQIGPIACCALAFGLDLYFWHASIRFIGPGLATIISNFQVFLMAGCGYFVFGEQLRPRFLVAMPLAIFGLFLVIGFNWSELTVSYRTGVIYGFLTALCYALFMLQLRSIQLKTSGNNRFMSLGLISLFSALFLGILVLLEGDTFALRSARSIASLVSLGFFSQTLGWLLIGLSLPRMQTSVAGLMLLLQPALSFIWDVLFFARPTDLLDWSGTLITLWAFYLGITGSKAKQ